VFKRLRTDIRATVDGRVNNDPPIVIQPGSVVVFFPAIAGG